MVYKEVVVDSCVGDRIGSMAKRNDESENQSMIDARFVTCTIEINNTLLAPVVVIPTSYGL